jgi:glycosyltransferase involved in cell wall biosynthesis
MKLSVIVPVLEDPRLFACLRSLFGQEWPGPEPYEVLVIDNGPSETVRRIAGAFPCRYAVEPRRGSFAARNRGIGLARGELLAFVDADCVVPSDWLRRIVALLSRPGSGFVTGPSDSMGDSRVAGWVQSVDDARERALSRSETVVYCDTRNLAGRREVFDRLRFDASLVECGDLEFALRATAAGERIHYARELRVAHHNPISLGAALKRSVRRGRFLAILYEREPAMRLSGERDLRLFGRDVKAAVLRTLQRTPTRGAGIAGLTALLGVMVSTLFLLKHIPFAAGLGVGPYRILDRGALLLGILLNTPPADRARRVAHVRGSADVSS